MKPTKTAAGKKPVTQPHQRTLLQRLTRIEGQVRGIARMIEQKRYCVDVLNQVSAVHAALDAVSTRLLEDHMGGCVQSAIKTGGGKQAIGELLCIMHKLSHWPRQLALRPSPVPELPPGFGSVGLATKKLAVRKVGLHHAFCVVTQIGKAELVIGLHHD